MGWKENGKFGITTGRTIRSPFASGYGKNPLQDSEVLLKFTRETDSLSSREFEEFLTENDIGDGLGDFTDSTTLRVSGQGLDRVCKVPYSLKKRKRWQLSENADVFLVPDDATDIGPNVIFIHRRMHQNLAADCFSLKKAKGGEVFLPRKRKYTRPEDLLKKCDETGVEPQVCYEMLYRSRVNEYPVCAEIHGRHLSWSSRWPMSNPCKARCKSKGTKNKGHRWGMYSDAEVRSGWIAKEGPFLQKQPCHVIESKLQVIPGVCQFHKLKCNTSLKERSSFYNRPTLGSYIDGCSRIPKTLSKRRHQRQHAYTGRITEKCESLSGCFKYGKKSVVYIDPEPDLHVPSTQNQYSAITPKPEILLPEKKAIAVIPLCADDVNPITLKSQWLNLYSEANSFPRKFTIDAIAMLSDVTNLNIDSCSVLFEVQQNLHNRMGHIMADVSLHITGAHNMGTAICEATGKFYSDIYSEINKNKIWRVRDVVDLAVVCVQEVFQPLKVFTKTKRPSKDQQKTWNSVQVLGSMFGWKFEVLTHSEVKSEMKKKMKKAQEMKLKMEIDRCNHKSDDVKSMGLLDMLCRICCVELGNQGSAQFTALTSCGHVFCNECWVAHLKTQISLGNTELQCPGYKCDADVDDTTIMALVPSWYGKVLTRKMDKALETSPELRWCPARSCGRIIKATTSGSIATTLDPLSVACACGGVWCFQCGSPSHWPAPCAVNEKFHEVTKEYLIQMELSKEELITSVMVRNCPKCRYPIEKHLGCNFMYCIMCQTAFCWECLAPMSKHKDGCKRHEQSREIELDLVGSSTSLFAKYFSVYCNNKKARSSMALSHQRNKLRLLNGNLESYRRICSSCSYFDHTIEKILQSDCHETLKDAADFMYYAHLTLEGAAKVAIVSKSSGRRLHLHMDRLQFIVDEIEGFVSPDVIQLMKCNNLQKLSLFLRHGKNCVLKIGQLLTNRNRNHSNS